MTKYFSKKQLFNALEPVKYSTFTFDQLEKYLENAEYTDVDEMFNESKASIEIDAMIQRIKQYRMAFSDDSRISNADLSIHISFLKTLKANLRANEKD